MGKVVWGILGGMGPLASAEFLRNINSSAIGLPEGAMPNLIYSSFPDLPDRTKFLKGNKEIVLAERLNLLLANMMDIGATRLVLCCYTAYAVSHLFAPRVRKSLFSLTSLAVSAIRRNKKDALILCSLGARDSGIFQSERSWAEASRYAIFPSSPDLTLLHDIIYEMKLGLAPQKALPEIMHIGKKYGANQWLIGCSELHMLSKYKRDQPGLDRIEFIDPLMDTATLISGRLTRTQESRILARELTKQGYK